VAFILRDARLSETSMCRGKCERDDDEVVALSGARLALDLQRIAFWAEASDSLRLLQNPSAPWTTQQRLGRSLPAVLLWVEGTFSDGQFRPPHVIRVEVPKWTGEAFQPHSRFEPSRKIGQKCCLNATLPDNVSPNCEFAQKVGI
jgi:hypothetical protein